MTDYTNPRRESDVDIEMHEEYNVAEVNLRQDDQFRQNMWVAILVGLDDKYGVDRDFEVYLNPTDDSGTGMVCVDHGMVLEIAESGTADEPAAKQHFWYDGESGELTPLPEDEVEDAVEERQGIIDSRRTD